MAERCHPTRFHPTGRSANFARNNDAPNVDYVRRGYSFRSGEVGASIFFIVSAKVFSHERKVFLS
ncbi:hypothetical protein GCWU000325_02536 [Alloprevotella tannerae ATCC 51259]|uniref:Uncharacterized protein n=1 Tax=Alloprevotella tannerae ATCC 51259 TaxID=626522 RepID=C9LJX2_9BACT|nr:hypothetical protein GCWU000325_02536 [Alloprevotella tannerae ATCC 51259]